MASDSDVTPFKNNLANTLEMNRLLCVTSAYTMTSRALIQYKDVILPV